MSCRCSIAMGRMGDRVQHQLRAHPEAPQTWKKITVAVSANVGSLAEAEQACSQPAYSGDVRQSLGACTTSSPVTLTENALRRPVVPLLPCKQSMWKASASPGSTAHCSSLNAEGSPSMSGTGSRVPLGNHLAVSVKNVVGRYHLPVCEPDTKHRDDSTGTGSTGNQKETFCVPSML